MKFSVNGIHKAFESRVRLGIMSALAVNDRLNFNSLKDYLEVTDGNLATHLKTLEREGFISLEKSFVGRKPNTRYFMTAAGKVALTSHLEILENFVKSHK